MTIERIPITDRESWLRMRKQDVTASVIGALWGVHPYQTPLGLYVEKSGVDIPEIDNAVLRRGRLLESAVAQAVAEERPDWSVTKATAYLRDPTARIGATPDFWIDGDPRGRIVMQAKTVAPSVFKKQWTEDMPPFWIVLQAHTEAMLAGAALGIIAALVIDPWKLDLHIYDVPRNATAEKKIMDGVRQFWADVEAKREPKADYKLDGALLAQMFEHETPGKIVDLTNDNMMPELLDERERLSDAIKDAEIKKKTIETEIKAKIGDAEFALTRAKRISWKTVNRKAYTVAATSYRQLRVSDRGF